MARHRLSLVLRLFDTSTGVPYADRTLKLYRNGQPISYQQKQNGYTVLMDCLNEDFMLTVEANGFEVLTYPVNYGQLVGPLPVLVLHLVPGKGYLSHSPALTLAGHLPHISSLDAARPIQGGCRIGSFHPEKRLVTLVNPNKLTLDRVYYAVLDPVHNRYEPFSILSQLTEQTFLIDRCLKNPFEDYFPVCPMVFGSVTASGRYRIRLQEAASGTSWIIRWKTPAGIQFKQLSPKDTEKLSLP